MARPSRPPLRQHTPDEVRSGFPFLIAMAAIVLAASVAAVAKFCPEDLDLRHPRARVASAAAPPPAASPPPAPATDDAPPVITPMALTTVDAPPLPAPKKVAVKGRLPSSRLPTKPTAAAASAAPVASASAEPVPQNPYEEASPPGTYGF